MIKIIDENNILNKTEEKLLHKDFLNSAEPLINSYDAIRTVYSKSKANDMLSALVMAFIFVDYNSKDTQDFITDDNLKDMQDFINLLQNKLNKHKNMGEIKQNEN